MAERDFFDETARRRVAEAVAAIEARTAAEVVVAMRHRAGEYRAADLLGGAILALAVLIAVLFLPRPFAVATIPLDVIVAFALGALATAWSPTLRRLLGAPRARAAAVRTAARAAFVDLGISRTRGRTGLLVYVAIFERRVEVVPDIGLDAVSATPEWRTAVEHLAAALRPAPDLARLLAALATLAPPLAAALPRSPDDENELPDAPITD